MSHYIHDEAAYEAAKQARIIANARKGRNARWLAEDGSRAAIEEYLRLNDRAGFLAAMFDALNKWGSLTAGQEAAVRKCMAADEARKVAREAARVEAAATAQHVGTVGKRQEWTLRVVALTGYESAYGYTHVNIFTDEAGNRIVHKGTAMGDYSGAHDSWRGIAKGDLVRFKATVKEHGEREGVRQTLLSRPVFIAFVAG